MGPGGVGRERPGPSPLPPGIGCFGGPGGGVQPWPGPSRQLLSACRWQPAESAANFGSRGDSPGWARREPGRGDESRSQVGGPGRASRAPAPGPSQRLLEVSRSLSTRRRPSRKPLLNSGPPRNKFCGFLGISRRVIGIHKNQFRVSRGLRGESSASADRGHSRLLGVLDLG